jgi:hypothetical protein
MTLHLHIDTLVLDGFDLDPAACLVLQRTAEAELGRLLVESGTLSERSTHFAALHGGALQLPPGHAPAELGRRLARAIHQGLPR